MPVIGNYAVSLSHELEVSRDYKARQVACGYKHTVVLVTKRIYLDFIKFIVQGTCL